MPQTFKNYEQKIPTAGARAEKATAGIAGQADGIGNNRVLLACYG
jgi:hypothetical protein